MTAPILALLSASFLVDNDLIDADAQAEVGALCESDPFILSVMTDLRAAFDTKIGTPVKARKTLDAAILLKADAYMGTLENGVQYLLQTPFAARPKASGSDELPVYHEYLWTQAFGSVAAAFRQRFEALLTTERATTQSKCSGLPANVTSWETYLNLSGKGQWNYALPGENPLTVNRPVKDKNGVVQIKRFNFASGARNDIARDAAAEASASKKAQEALAAAQLAEAQKAQAVANGAAVPPVATVPAPEAAEGM